MADSSNVDAAVITKLSGDATLMASLTNGVFADVATPGSTLFAIVSQVDHNDEYMFEGCAYERFLYLVKAVCLGADGTTVKTAAARIHTLLQDVPLTITGYSHMLTRREGRIRYTEVDDADPAIRWQHRGGRYEVLVSPS